MISPVLVTNIQHLNAKCINICNDRLGDLMVDWLSFWNRLLMKPLLSCNVKSCSANYLCHERK